MKAEYETTHFYTHEAYLPEDFWLITAFNPNGEDASPEQNDKRDSDLWGALTDFDITPFRIFGRNPDGSHEEAGWGAMISEEEALDFAEEFEQEAVYHFQDGRIHLVGRSPRVRVALSEPEKRVHLIPDTRGKPILTGDSDYIWPEILEWAGIADLWCDHDLWDKYDVNEDLLDHCNAACVDSHIVHVNSPGGSDETFSIFSEQPDLLKTQMKERTQQLITEVGS